MKKRAVLSAVAGFVLAGAMCMSFAACGGENEAESLVGEKVDKETWEAALDLSSEAFDNFELKVEFKASEKVVGKGIEINTRGLGLCSYDNQKTYTKLNPEITISGFTEQQSEMLNREPGEQEYEYYYDKTGESERYICKLNGVRVERTPYVDDGDDGTYGLLMSILLPDAKETLLWKSGGAVSYASYEYSEEHKGYIHRESIEENGAETNALTVVKFKDGKLKSIYTELYQKAENVPVIGGVWGTLEVSETISYIINYGGQSVTLPDIA